MSAASSTRPRRWFGRSCRRWPKADRTAIVQGWAGVYSSFLLHAEHAAERYGVAAHEILQRAGEAGYVGGQEDMLIDIALQLAQERDLARGSPLSEGEVDGADHARHRRRGRRVRVRRQVRLGRPLHEVGVRRGRPGRPDRGGPRGRLGPTGVRRGAVAADGLRRARRAAARAGGPGRRALGGARPRGRDRHGQADQRRPDEGRAADRPEHPVLRRPRPAGGRRRRSRWTAVTTPTPCSSRPESSPRSRPGTSR